MSGLLFAKISFKWRQEQFITNIEVMHRNHKIIQEFLKSFCSVVFYGMSIFRVEYGSTMAFSQDTYKEMDFISFCLLLMFIFFYLPNF